MQIVVYKLQMLIYLFLKYKKIFCKNLTKAATYVIICNRKVKRWK